MECEFTGGYFCYFGVIFHEIVGKGVNTIVACVGCKNSKLIKMELLCFRFARQHASISEMLIFVSGKFQAFAKLSTITTFSPSDF